MPLHSFADPFGDIVKPGGTRLIVQVNVQVIRLWP
jgi:hypothetical protein